MRFIRKWILYFIDYNFLIFMIGKLKIEINKKNIVCFSYSNFNVIKVIIIINRNWNWYNNDNKFFFLCKKFFDSFFCLF